MTNLENRNFLFYKKLHKKGVFGIFLSKLAISNDLEVLRIIKNYQDKLFLNELYYREMANRKDKFYIDKHFYSVRARVNCRYEDDPIFKLKNIENYEAIVDFKFFGCSKGTITKDHYEKLGADNLKNYIQHNQDVYFTDKGQDTFENIVEEDKAIAQRNILVNYYLFKKLSKKPRNNILKYLEKDMIFQ